MEMARASTARDLIREIVWRQRRQLAAGVTLLFVDRAAGFVLPLAPKVLVDEVIGKRRADLLPWLAVAIVAAALVQAAVTIALTRVLGLSAERVVLGFRRRVMARVLGLPAADLDGMQSGALVSRVLDDANAMQNVVGFELARWLSNVVTAAVALAALVYLDWRMTLAALAVAAVPGFALDLTHRRMRPLFHERAVLRADLAGRLAQTLSGVRIVRAYTAERRERLAFAKALHRWYRVLASAAERKSRMNAVAVVASACVVGVVVVMGGRAMLDGRMSLGDFASYVAFALMFASPLLDLPDIATRASETLAHLDRLRELSEARPEDPGGGASVGEVRGEVAFERVSFAYEPGRDVLRDVTFTAHAGHTTALVGASGAGKSTVLSLVLRFYAPREGAVRLDGVDVAGLDLRDYRGRLSVVLQDDLLFDASIADNIAYARPRATREEVERAARVAHCDEFTARLPDGLDTRVGERGVKLSGGQRQRVAIARAVLADAPVLLLDEATSSLDAESETLVRSALAALSRGRTVIVIAHRLSTVRAADQIVVLDRGAVVDVGTHDALLGRSARYRELYDAQFGGAPGRESALTESP